MSERWEAAVDTLLEIRSGYRSRPDIGWHLFKHADAALAPSLSRHMIRGLDASDAIYVSPDVADVYEHACQSFQPENLKRSDPFVDAGLAVFPRMVSIKNSTTIGFEENGKIVLKHPGEGTTAFSVLLWRCEPTQIYIWMLARSEEWHAPDDDPPHPVDRFFLVTGAGRRKWDDPILSDESGLLPVQAFWKLASALVTGKQKPSRGVVRRLARAKLEPRSITVIRLRRARYPREGEAQSIDWSCRWLVRGHWRRYQDGRQTYIAPYVKGPDDKPFRVTDRVFEFIR